MGFVRFYTLGLIILGLTFYVGYEVANFQKRSLISENKLLNKSLSNLKSVNEKLQSNYNVLKVELDIAQLTNERSQESIKESINREQALKEQITFYQRVMAPEMTQDGFVVQHMEVTPTASDRNYSLKVVMLQHENVKAVIKGELDIKVFGSANGKPTSFNITSLQDAPKTSLSFAFRYFQILETSVTFPEGFTAERFELSTSVYKYNKRRGNYSTTIKWDEAFVETE
jgi:hypothetical protein